MNSNFITPGGFIGIDEAKESQELETPKNAIVGQKFLKNKNFNKPQLENLEEENQDDHDSQGNSIIRNREGDKSPLASAKRHQPQSYKIRDEGLSVQQSAQLIDQGDVNERPKNMVDEERVNEKKESYKDPVSGGN